jgi:hypothetical protein
MVTNEQTVSEDARPDVACSATLDRDGLTLPSRLHLLLLNDSGTLSREEREAVKEARDEIERLRAEIDRACNALTDSICVSGNDARSNMAWVNKLRATLDAAA